MQTQLIRKDLPESLRPDARDGRLPALPGEGFRNLFHMHEAAEGERWRGCGSTGETLAMLQRVAAAMMRPPGIGEGRPPREGELPSGYAYFAQFAAHDFQFSTNAAVYPPQTVEGPALRRRRLLLETIYREGPERDPELFGEGSDALAPYRFRVGKFGPGVGVWRRTLPRHPRSTVSGDPDVPLCAADARNDENPIVAQIAGLFMRLHNVALRRLPNSDPAERFEAARRVTRAAFRRILFDDLAARLLRDDVRALYERDGPRDRAAAETDDVPVEFSHCVFRAAHALVRADYAMSETVNGGMAVNVREMIRHTSRRDPEAFRRGKIWAVDWRRFFGPAALRAQPLGPHVNVFFAEAPGLLPPGQERDWHGHMIVRDLARGMESGPLSVAALGARVAPMFAGRPGLDRWLAFDASHCGAAVAGWAARDRALARWLPELREDPPLYLYALIEAAAPEDQGGGGGRGFGALGSVVLAELFYAARAANRAEVEDAPELEDDAWAVFGARGLPADMDALIEFLETGR